MRRLYPGGKFKALTLSYDDGVEQDIRLLEIMKKHGLKGTFNLNGGYYAPEGTVYPATPNQRRMSKSMATEVFTDCGMEIATHGYTHAMLTALKPSMCVYEIMKDREALEEQFGRIVNGHAYPFGEYNSSVIEYLRSCGIVYARNVDSTEKFELPEEWLRWGTTCHHNNPRLMELAKEYCDLRNAKRLRVFYLWGHSYEFERDDNWHVIEEFAEFMGGRDDLWYATNGEIYEYVQNLDRMVISADGRTLYNPCYQELWVELDGKPCCIKPGETYRW